MSDNTLVPADAVPVIIESPVQGGTEEERQVIAELIAVRSSTPPAAVEPTPDPAELTAATPKRAFALDALRGLFLISMTFGFTISSDSLPAWMYHRQLPPPGDVAVNIAGISWRDLAYAAFLFTMAAALPLTLSRRIAKGEPEIGITVAAVRRYALLLIYGLLVAHANTYFIGYSDVGRALSIVGFGVMAMIFTRRRKDWNEARFEMLHRAGWVLAIAFLALSPLTYGKTFTFARIDDIMVDLAFASLAGALIWYFTRDNLNVRLAILAGAVALYLGAKEDGWLQQWWYSSPVPWAFQPSRLSLLTVVIPGTIAGDVILRWMRVAQAKDDPDPMTWSNARLAGLAAICAVITPIVVVGLYNRQGALTLQACLALAAAGFLLVRKPATPAEHMLRSLFLWGAMWLLLGLALEPFEGGIKKEPETLSYFFTVTGTTLLLLAGMTALTDGLKRSNAVRVLIDVGQNPLLAYVLFTVLLNSVFELTPPMRSFLQATPAQSVARSIVSTVVTIALVCYVSRKRIYWRT